MKKTKPTQAEVLLQIIGNIDLFHTPDNQVYARPCINGHYEVWGVRSKGFRRLLSHLFFVMEGRAPGAQVLNDVISTIEGNGQFARPEKDIHLRVAQMDDHIYVDLANPKWEVVEITRTGWRVLSEAPVFFRRSKGMLSLPTPDPAGDMTGLRGLLNLPRHEDDPTFRMIVAWLVQAFRPTGPYPILVLSGEQGSAKSMTSIFFRSLLDPNVAPLRSLPTNTRDLAIAANNSWALVFDNCSFINADISDALCRLSTGGGFATRELYQDADEVIFHGQRPIILNGIDDMVRRHDLGDRSIFLILPPIGESKIKPESELLMEFDTYQGVILGGIFDALVMALNEINNVALDCLPRMADFAMWISAAEGALPWDRGMFIHDYMTNREHLVERSLDNDLIATAIRNWINGDVIDAWEGTSTDLLEQLEKQQDERTLKSKKWPTTPAVLSKRVRRVSSFLRKAGIDITFDDVARPRMIRIERDLECFF